MFVPGPRILAYNSSPACIQTLGKPFMIGGSGSRAATWNGSRFPWDPAGPADVSGVSLPPSKYHIGPAFSLRLRHPPTPIISLNAFQFGNALSAAWTVTTPPPSLTYCSNEAIRSAGHSGESRLNTTTLYFLKSG